MFDMDRTLARETTTVRVKNRYKARRDSHAAEPTQDSQLDLKTDSKRRTRGQRGVGDNWPSPIVANAGVSLLSTSE